MSDIIATSIQRLEQDAIITMFEIDAEEFDEGTFRFTNEIATDGGPIEYNGYQYFPMPIQAEGFEWSGQGTLPSPTLTISAIDPSIRALVLSAGDLVGAPIKRIRTYRKHLDDGSDPDPERRFDDDHYVIERKTSQTKSAIQFELAVKMAQRGQKLPARQFLRSACTHTYRRWNGSEFIYTNVTCPYVGDDYYEQDGSSTQDPSEDLCGKRLSDCKLRFGENNELPTRVFPGVGRY